MHRIDGSLSEVALLDSTVSDSTNLLSFPRTSKGLRPLYRTVRTTGKAADHLARRSRDRNQVRLRKSRNLKGNPSEDDYSKNKDINAPFP